MNDADFEKLEQRVHLINRPEKALLAFYVLSSLLACFAFPLVIVPLFFRYETLRYRFDGQGVFMSYGILFRKELQLTYDRMQDIHLSQNILERWLGIGSITIQTAGAGAGGNLKIVGVKAFDEIRDYLYARMRGIRDDAGHAHGSAAETEQVLRDIRDALQGAATALAAKTYAKTQGLA
jgi:putative membrane protein